jgi:gliding motility-associated-like protein
MKILCGCILLLCCLLQNAVGQRGKVITKATTQVLDPNQDDYVSLTNAGFSNDGYYVDEFEYKMFGIPIFADGEVLNDNQVGPNCGTTDLIVDKLGYAVYGVLDDAGNLIFRFRVGTNQPSVEAYSILIDTDGLFGVADPDSTAENPGFEIDITFIKNRSKGVYVYDINGLNGCPTPALDYDFRTNAQIAVADLVTCGNPDYFYDFYVPFNDIASAFGLTTLTEMRFVAVTNISATCALNGKISDVGGVDGDLYGDCLSCAFGDLIHNQCPTALASLCKTCQGFLKGRTPKPRINGPLKAGELTVTGTTLPLAEIFLTVRNVVVKESATVLANGAGGWAVTLVNQLIEGDTVLVRARVEGSCQSGTSNTGQDVAIVIENARPQVSSSSGLLIYTENDPATQLNPPIIISDADDAELDGAVIAFTMNLAAAEDALIFQDQNGITGTYQAGTGVLTLTGTATVADYQAAIRSVRYRNNSEAPSTATRTISITVTDGLDTNIPFLTNVQVVSVNDPPVLSPMVAPLSYAPALSTVTVHNTLSVSDADNTQLTGAVVHIVDTTFFAAEDRLLFTNQSGITGNYNTGTGILSLTGTASLADYMTALRSIQYTNVDATPSLKTRVVVFRVTDGADFSNLLERFILFSGINNPPDIIDDEGNKTDTLYYTMSEDEVLTSCVTATDPDGDLLALTAFEIITGQGAVSLEGGLCFRYEPDSDFFGEDRFKLTVCDNRAPIQCATVVIIVSVAPVNDPPVLQASTVQMNENTTRGICVAYTDIENDQAIFTSGTPVNSVGTVADGTAGDACFLYTPDRNFFGTEEVEVTLCDPDDPTVCGTTIITIDVLEVNDPPVILVNGLPKDTLYTSAWEDSVHYFCFEAVDPEGDDVLFNAITNRAGGGSMLLDDIEFCFFFTPTFNYNGESIWEVSICDDGSPMACGKLIIVVDVLPVNDPPVAVRDTLYVRNDEPVEGDVLENDTDLELNNLSLQTTAERDPLHGEARLFSDGTVRYTTELSFVGTDSLYYRVYDDGVPSRDSLGVVIFIVDFPAFKIYDALSPNNDGQNDYWRINGIERFPRNHVRIFDRYNNLVFEMRSYNNETRAWRGDANHGLTRGSLPEGTYYYTVDLGNGRDLYKGFVVLKRS